MQNQPPQKGNLWAENLRKTLSDDAELIFDFISSYALEDGSMPNQDAIKAFAQGDTRDIPVDLSCMAQWLRDTGKNGKGGGLVDRIEANTPEYMRLIRRAIEQYIETNRVEISYAADSALDMAASKRSSMSVPGLTDELLNKLKYRFDVRLIPRSTATIPLRELDSEKIGEWEYI
ncbi:hypothetical protein KIPB_009318 [Kipferlia bialata]|uniref:Uncharacterized protein n=1 Tax=Kipferlia bialata TaxID=797122 RepID=A0A9K3D3G2_9EUKA|nr:hypothetical protein KIPB_009318 [Kipferlia bialata]|eukprot:g9318.t1